MGDMGNLIASMVVVLGGIAGIIKLWPVVSSNLSTTIAGNRASEKTIEVLQEMVASERTARLAAEAETRKFISEWAEMKSRFDVMTGKLDQAETNSKRQDILITELTKRAETLTNRVQELTEQLRQAGK